MPKTSACTWLIRPATSGSSGVVAAWRAAVGGVEDMSTAAEWRAAERDRHWRWESVVASRRTAASFGGWEYLVKWDGGAHTWEVASRLSDGASTKLMTAMRSAREHNERPNSMWALVSAWRRGADA